MTSTTSRSKKVLAPLAVLLAAGALAVGSGATFTSATDSTIETVTSGSLTLTNDGFVFDEGLANLKPGESREGELTLNNTGTIPAEVTLTQTNVDNTFENDALSLTIAEVGGDSIHTGLFDDLGSKSLGTLAGESSKTYAFTVTLAANAGDVNQNKTADATFNWDAVQTND